MKYFKWSVIFFSLIASVALCRFWYIENKCSNCSFDREIIIKGYHYQSSLNGLKVYRGKRGNHLKNLELFTYAYYNQGISSNDSTIAVVFAAYYFIEPNCYDYRLVIDDTIYFDFSNFVFEKRLTAIPSASDNEYEERCTLKSYDINGINYTPVNPYRLEAPFKLARIVHTIKK